MQILQIPMQSSPDKRGWTCTLLLGCFHGVERGRISNRQVVQMSLEVLIGGKAKALNNSHCRGRVCVQTVSEGTHTEQDVRAGILQDGTNDFLAFGTEVPKLVSETAV
jgi:hypothetical protein